MSLNDNGIAIVAASYHVALESWIVQRVGDHIDEHASSGVDDVGSRELILRSAFLIHHSQRTARPSGRRFPEVIDPPPVDAVRCVRNL